MNKDYTKFGGWLIFFIIVQILGGVVAFREYISFTQLDSIANYMNSAFMVKILFTIATILLVIGSAAGVIAVLIRSRKVIIIHFILSAIYLLIMGVVFILLTNVIDANYINSFKTNVLISIARSLVIMLVWIRMFMNSSRAKVYFGIGDYISK